MEEDRKLVNSVRLPLFDGKRSSFRIWWTRFMAFATVYLFRAALALGGEAALPATEEEAIYLTEEDGKQKEAAKRRNAKATANFMMAFSS